MLVINDRNLSKSHLTCYCYVQDQLIRERETETDLINYYLIQFNRADGPICIKLALLPNLAIWTLMAAGVSVCQCVSVSVCVTD